MSRSWFVMNWKWVDIFTKTEAGLSRAVRVFRCFCWCLRCKSADVEEMSQSSVCFCAQRWMTRTARGGGWSAWTRWPPWRNSSPTWRSSKFASKVVSSEEGRMWTSVRSTVLVMTFTVASPQSDQRFIHLSHHPWFYWGSSADLSKVS